MATVERFEDLKMWKKARLLSQSIYEIISSPPFSRDFGLKDQINRASGSIMDNIAEGFGRGSRLEFANFLSIARASASEVKSQLYRAQDRGYIDKELFGKLYSILEEICKMIYVFADYLNKSDTSGLKFKDRRK